MRTVWTQEVAMRAAVQRGYGPPEVLTIAGVDRPRCGPGDVLVEVRASPVTAGDRRMRAADFPSFTWLPGRLMLGVFGPRNRPGTAFAGRVVEVGRDVTRYAPGDDVFGFAGFGAYAEYVAMPADGAVARMPPGLDYASAAALPYGAVTALVYLRDRARVQPRERVAVIGAAGGVGRIAIQVARHLGAEVTAVCRASDRELVRSLGAHHAVDRDADLAATGPYDVIFDTADALSWAQATAAMTPRGRLLVLGISVEILWRSLWTRLRGGRTLIQAVALPVPEHLETIRAMAARGDLRPALDRTFPLDDIAAAHRWAEQARGTVTIAIGA
jgi:NADPH:quinone reductase-like Zn-dependent oxidoreductase